MRIFLQGFLLEAAHLKATRKYSYTRLSFIPFTCSSSREERAGIPFQDQQLKIGPFTGEAALAGPKINCWLLIIKDRSGYDQPQGAVLSHISKIKKCAHLQWNYRNN